MKQESSYRSGGNLSVQACQNPLGNDLIKNVWGPFQKLPNVSKFSVNVSDYDPLFLEYGIKKRLPPVLEYTPHVNNRLNRYIEHQLKRMTHANPMKF